MTIQKLPVGIQSFEKLRTENYLYINKTEFIYRLATEGQQYFLNRPRRCVQKKEISQSGK